MSNNKSIVVAIVVVGILLAIAYVGWGVFNTVKENNEMREYCNNFSANIEQEKAALEQNALAMPWDYDRVNEMVAKYNQECAY